MMVVVMIPAIVVIVIAVRVVMMMVMMPPTVMVMVMVDQFICAGSPRMSAMGQKRKCPGSRGRSVLPTGADIVSLPRHVRLVPQAEVGALIRSPHQRVKEAPVG